MAELQYPTGRLRSIQIPSALDRQKELLGLQTAQRQGRLADMQLNEAERKQQVNQQIMQALTETGGDIEAALPRIAQIDQEAFIALSGVAESQKTTRINRDLAGRKLDIENAAAMEGTAAPTATVGKPGLWLPPPSTPSDAAIGPGAMLVNGKGVAPIPSPIPTSFEQDQPMPRMQVRGSADLGVPATTRVPLSQAQTVARKVADMKAKAAVDAEQRIAELNAASQNRLEEQKVARIDAAARQDDQQAFTLSENEKNRAAAAERSRIAAAARLSSSGLSPTVASKVGTISQSFDSSPIVKQYNDTQNKLETTKSILSGVRTGPGDLAQVFEFMRGLDPTSVVRESEYATAAESGNLFAGWAAKFNGYLKPEGGFLPENVRQEFMSLLGKKLETSQRQVNNLRAEQARKINKWTGRNDGEDYLTDFSGGASSGTIKVQIPGQPPGEIDADMWEVFKKDHPTATRIPQ